MQLNSSALNEEELNGGTSLVIVELTTAALNTSTNAISFLRTKNLQITSLDFSRQVFQITRQNHQDVATFDFNLGDGISVSGNAVSLDVASFGVVAANDISFARANHLAEYALDFSPQPVQPTSSTTLDAATLDMAEEPISVIRTVALGAASFDFLGGTSNPSKLVTLTNETLNFVVLDVTPANAPLGVVQELTAASFDFVGNDIVGTHSLTLDTPAFDFETYETQNTTQNKLGVVAFDLIPQSLTVIQLPGVVTLTAANFDFNPESVQLTGISSAGDRKRMLFGVGR